MWSMMTWAWAAPPSTASADMIGGVELGSTVDRSEWFPVGRSLLQAGQHMGRPGLLQATLCGDQIRTIGWAAFYVPRFYDPPPDAPPQLLAAAIVAPSSPEAAADRTRHDLRLDLASADWYLDVESETPTVSLWIRGSHRRTVLSQCDDRGACVVSLLAASEAPCLADP